MEKISGEFDTIDRPCSNGIFPRNQGEAFSRQFVHPFAPEEPLFEIFGNQFTLSHNSEWFRDSRLHLEVGHGPRSVRIPMGSIRQIDPLWTNQSKSLISSYELKLPLLDDR